MWSLSLYNQKKFRFLFVLLVSFGILFSPNDLNAQAETSVQAETRPFFLFGEMDDSDFPDVTLQLRPNPTTALKLATTAPFRIEEDGEVRTVDEYSDEESALQVGFLLDPVMIDQKAYSGQTYLADIAYAFYEMIAKDTFRRNGDTLAAFTMLPDGQVAAIQDWTSEPNLIYNALYEQPPEALGADLLPTAAWINVLGQFKQTNLEDSTVGRTLIVFLVGSQNIPNDFLAAASSLGVQLHILDLASTNPNIDRSGIIAALNEVGGTYLAYQSIDNLQEFYLGLGLTRTVYQLAYQSALSEPGPATVSVMLTDGSMSNFIIKPNALTVSQGTSNSSDSSDSSESMGVATAEAASPVATDVPLEEPASTGQNSTGQNSTGQSSTQQVAPEETENEQADAGQVATEQVATEQVAAEQNDASEDDQGVTSTVASDEGGIASSLDIPTTDSATESIEEQPQLSPAASNVGGTNMITIPLLNADVPRLALQIALPLLLLLIIYVLYTEWRDRRMAKRESTFGQQGRSPLYGEPSNSEQQWPAPRMPINDGATSVPVHDPYSNFLPQNQAQSAESASNSQSGLVRQTDQSMSAVPSLISSSSFAEQAMQEPSDSTTERPMPSGADSSGPNIPNASGPNSIYVQQPGDEEATISVLSQSNDDEVTYRLTEEVVTPIIGHLMRVTSDPNLPQMLPIYKLSSSVDSQHQLYIGRHSKKNTIVINDKRVSREHAVIVQKDGQLFLRDNGSTSGTFLNWKQLRVGEELVLRHSDIISLGDIVYEFRMLGEDEATVPTR